MSETVSSSVEFKTNIYKLEYLLNVHYLEVPSEVIQQLGGKLKVRLHCNVNDTISFQCGLVALGNGNAYISLNNKRMKQLGVQEGDEVRVVLKKDESKYGLDVPEELEELLKQDEEGRDRFEKLPPGKQRYIIYYVGGVKSNFLRLERAIRLIENLKQTTPGKESFSEILGNEKE